MTFFIYFSLIGEVLIAVFATIMFFLPGIIAKWASIFFFISELPFLASGQILVIITDPPSPTTTYVTFGVPALYLAPFLYLFSVLAFIAVENLFDSTERDMLGRKKR
jgi:hypothetical protein